MATLIPFVFTQFFDNNGDPLNGGKVYTYEAGTTTPKATYTTSTGLVANANPVILDSAGRAQIWLGDGGYKFILKTSADVVVGSTFDNIGGTTSTAFAGNVQEISTNTTVDETLANSAFIATAALTLSLPDVATAGEGFYFSVSAFGGDVIIDPDTTETINNASTLTIAQGASAIIMCDGDEWWTMCYTGGIVAGQLASNAVTTVKILDDAVTLAKIDGDAGFANKLIGYDGSGDPANITAGSGVSIASSVISAAAGAVLQVVSVDMTGTFTSSGNAYQDITGLTASITPASSSNKILVIVQVQGDTTTNNCFLKLVRGSTDIGIGAAASNRTRAGAQINVLGGTSFQSSAPMVYLDSPATTSSTTYKVQGIVPSAGTFYINRSNTDTDSATFSRTASSITLIEIKG